MKFDWDQNKNTSNEKKHRISFTEAITVFDDPFALIAPDPKHSTENEIREWIIGEADWSLSGHFYNSGTVHLSHH